ncbi:hypothetical protein [Pseudoxanthomonas sp. JBR18]|uniref:hypothetical protein n=1 Tax=Pseudoxanthomonas sp. JBR18 TaxID=2969308 RepID=UPI00230591DF|nr:hypothetical protein [Pseudoxanthomonas sp. JBR18]WCE02599.1 hypothetical protein PJ250_10565 [Pseudoxanthomonas sp. JBR18]
MNRQTDRREDAACIIVNIGRERAFWKGHYMALPGCGPGIEFEAFWPLLVRAYDIYLHHPHAGREVGAVLYANSPEVIEQQLEMSMAGRIFGRVMDRIQQATTRLQYAGAMHA